MRLTTLFALLVGCGTTPGGGDTDATGVDDWQPVVYLDEGALCFDDQGTEIAVSVTVSECLSSSCSRAFAGSCTAVLDGTTLTVTSDIRWEQNEGEGVACTDDCGSPTASCTLADLPDGTYTVDLGGVASSLVVPIADPCDPFGM